MKKQWSSCLSNTEFLQDRSEAITLKILLLFSRLEQILPRLQIFILDKYNSLVRQTSITLPSHRVLSSR